MNKIFKRTAYLLFIVIAACGYKPLLQNNYPFSINSLTLSGDEKVNKVLNNRLNSLIKNKKEINYDVQIINELNKKTISKDSKGDPLIFEIIIDVEINIRSEDKILLKKKLQKKNSYKNKSDKFELEEFENTVIKNLSIIIVENTIAAMSNLK